MNRVYDIKPIPTTYQGITYKSRLEARWAVFFKYLDVEALYEYEGYQLPSGWYVPDFYIPSMNMWFEVKPNALTESETKLCWELQAATKREVGMLTGDMVFQNFQEPNNGYSITGDQPYFFCMCPSCFKIGFQYDGRGARVCGDKCFPHEDKLYTSNSQLFVNAYDHAARYQFKVLR